MGNPVYNYDTAPNGEQEATRIVSNGGSYPQIVETITGLTVGQEYTASFYVKSDGTSQIQQATHFTGLSGGIGFTPTDNWERASYTITATATTHNFVIFTNSGSAPASSYLIWGPQVEEGTTASSFVENTTGSPKFITGATYGPRVPMILVEPSATNLVEYSEDFSEWNIGDTQPLLNQITSPDGSTNAAKLNALNTSNQGYISNNIPVTASTTYTFSTYAKKGEQKFVCLVGLNPFTESYFDLESGTALSNNATSSSIEDVGNGWFRLSATFDAQTSTKFAGIYLSQTGNSLVASSIPNGEGVYIWGAQLETGSVATSYIPNPAPISSTLNSVTSFEADGSVGGFNNIHVESIAGISGKEVEVEFEIFDYVSGTAACLMGFAFTPSIQVGGSLNANGIYRGVVTADSNNRILFRNNSNTDNFTGKIRNIKVVEVDTSGARAADNLVISGSDFDFFNASEGTVYTEFVPTQASAGRYVWSINNGTYSSRTFQNILSNLQLTNTYRINNSDSFLQTITTHNVSPNEINRTAFTYSSDLFQSSIDGNNSSSNSGATTSAFNKLNLGATAVSSDINTYALTGHVKRLIYWPYSSDRL
jgi:hypothetical protein